jgi:hypothetical protein
MEEIEYPHCRGTGKLTLTNSQFDNIISIPYGWFEEYEELQNKMIYHVHLLKTLGK